jgi:hypothetical protein
MTKVRMVLGLGYLLSITSKHLLIPSKPSGSGL